MAPPTTSRGAGRPITGAWWRRSCWRRGWRRPPERPDSGALQRLPEDAQHGGVDVQVGGDDVAVLQKVVAPLEVADRSPRLAHQETPGRDVPRRQGHLPESVVAAAGDVGEVERRRPVPPDPGRSEDERAERSQVVVEAIERSEREAGDQERLRQLLGGR